jgi:hypothetical protein
MATGEAFPESADIQSNQRMLELLTEAMRLIRSALAEGRRNDAVRLYHANEDDSRATAGALLSAWSTFVRYLDHREELNATPALPDLAAQFIHRAYLRLRREKYRARQIQEQLDTGRAVGKDGSQLPFDPVDPRQREEVLKNVRLEIAEVLGRRPPRDRCVIEKWVEGFGYEEIVEQVRAALPGEKISLATVSRIVQSFCDEMQRSLQDE